MTFTITYRDKTGAKHEEAQEAASREAAFAAAKARGISPMSIHAGAGRAAYPMPPQSRASKSQTNANPDGAERRPYKTRRRFLAVLGGTLVFLAILGGAWWWLGRMENGKWKIENEGDLTAVQSMPKEVVQVVSPKPVVVPKPVAATKSPRQKRLPQPDFFSKPRSEWTSAEEAIAMRYWVQDTNNIIEGIDMRTRIPPPAYSNAVQGILAAYTEPGADCIPFGPISDAEAREIIATKITYSDDDSDELVEQKTIVAAMLQELKEYMDGGGHAKDYFDRLEERQKLENEAMQTVRDEVSRLRDGGDYDGAKAALDRYNEYLKSKGLPKVRIRTQPKRGRKKQINQEG